jgi:7-carboxy-7-deazaguanine synthase
MRIPISEEFASVQGEGMFTGVPSYFVRTSGCNLRCHFCDTPYTSWKPEMHPVKTIDILGRIANAQLCRHVVITGGEPMLYPEAVAQLVKGCHSMGKVVTVETNGTLYDRRVFPDLYSVSPKLKSSTPQAGPEKALHERNIAATDLQQFLSGARSAQFKFVVTCDADIGEVQAMVDEHRLHPEHVWLMPEGRTAEEVMAKARWVVEACRERGFNLSMRVHTLLWGAKRGV